ncbi:hypothetical protein [Denitromonas halophila]|uniref:Uncharacterized protein n=1 Tax=Denitromonas halophila TaxID=1629404 RepID=A0A557R0A8_9RHOO|nr:hypothetical protein [Denitromonas halophila]TVO58590.1 hypothetical protein FHP91_02685 [Denitromonas halophila]
MTESNQPAKAQQNWRGLHTVLLFLVAVLCGGLIYQQHRFQERLDALASVQNDREGRLIAELHQLNAAVAAVTATSSQHNALLHRSLGKVLPLELPAETTRVFDEVERQLASPESWPTDAATVEARMSELQAVLEASPPWIQEALLPRLVPAHWSLQVLALVRELLPEDVEALDGRIEQAELLIASRPMNASDALVTQLDDRQAGMVRLLRAKLQQEAVLVAEKALKGESDPEEALALLADFESPVLEALRAQLNNRRQMLGLKRRAEALTQQWPVLEKISAPDLKERFATGFRVELQMLQLDALSASIQDAQLETQIDSLRQSVENALSELADAANKRSKVEFNDYQRWALTQIDAVSPLKEVSLETKAKEGLKRALGNKVKSAASSAQDALTRDMIQHLSVIDVHLLDVAVAEWYQEIFSERFASLDMTHKKRVVDAFANSSKKSLGAT